MTEKQKRFRSKHKQSNCQALEFSADELQKELLRELQALRVPSGTARAVADQVVKQVGQWVEKKPAVTMDDIYRKVAAEAEKYNPDLAYVYQNRGKII